MKKILLTLMVLGMAVSANAWEIHKGSPPTAAGKARISSYPSTWDIADGYIASHHAWRGIGHDSNVGTDFGLVWNVSDGDPFVVTSGGTTVRLSSSSTADTGGITVYVTGLDSNGALFAASQALNGRTPVTLAGVSPYRIFLMQNWTDTEYVGDIYAAGIDATYTDGVPDQASLILGKIDIGFGNSMTAGFTIPAGAHGHLTNWRGSTSSNKLTEMALQYRPYGLSWRTILIQHINQDHFVYSSVYQLRLESLTDVRILARVGVAGGDVSAGFGLWYED